MGKDIIWIILILTTNYHHDNYTVKGTTTNVTTLACPIPELTWLVHIEHILVAVVSMFFTRNSNLIKLSDLYLSFCSYMFLF